MPKKTRKKSKGNIKGNFRGKEDAFWKSVRDGFIKFLKPPDWSKNE